MEKNSLTIIFFSAAVSLALCARAPAASVYKQKKELEEIQRQLSKLEADLEKYEDREDGIKKEIRALKVKRSRVLREIKDLNWLLYVTGKKQKISLEKYNILKKAYSDWKIALAGEMRLYFINSLSFSPYYGANDMIKEIFLKSVIRKKFALLGKAADDSSVMEENLSELEKKKKNLKHKKRYAQIRRANYERSAGKKEGELGRVEREKRKISAKIEELSEDARGLKSLIERLKRQSPYKTPADVKVPLVKHSLPWPATGGVISKFGRENLPELKTWIKHEGIKIETEKKASVFPVENGRVIYAGPFRSYGKVIIVSHGSFSSIYGMLSSINVSVGEEVQINTVMGYAGTDTQDIQSRNEDKSVVYFEIRVGASAVDPLPWLRLRN